VKVALVTSIERGGPVEHARLLARELVADGVAVRAVVATDALAGAFAAFGAEPILLPLRPGLDGAGARRLAGAVRGVDVIHSHDRRAGLWGRLGPRPRRGGVRVHTLHGLPEPYLPPPAGPQRPSWRAALAYRGLERSLARRTDALLAPSHGAADALAARIGYARSSITVVPNAVDAAAAVPGGSGELIGVVAALEPVKAVDGFVRAAARLAQERPGLRFAVFGDGPLAVELRALAEELRAPVEFAGWVPSGEALARLRVFVLPSYFETSGIALMEAMAAGVPAVATAVGGIPESAPDGLVELVPPGDPQALAAAVARVLDDPDGAARRAAAAREHVLREATPRRTAELTRAVYERALAGRR